MERYTMRLPDDLWAVPVDGYDWTQEIIDRLAFYEDAEEQERLIILPCKMGDVLWDTESLTESPSRHIVLGFDVLKSLNMVHLSGGQSLPVSEIGKTVFLTREEAEAALGKERDM